MTTRHSAVVGTVDSWSPDEGWGVLRTPTGLSVFCHFSQVEMDGYRALSPGTSVYFDYEEPGQDGCNARVLTAARIAVASGENSPLLPLHAEPVPDSSAYGSGLTIVLDQEPEGRGKRRR